MRKLQRSRERIQSNKNEDLNSGIVVSKKSNQNYFLEKHSSPEGLLT